MFSRVSGTNKKYAQYGSLSHRRSFLASFLFDILILWYNKHRRSGNPCIFRDSRLFCYYRVISSAFNGL